MGSRRQAMQRIFGAIIALSSLVAVPPMLIAHWLGEHTQGAFLDSFTLMLEKPKIEPRVWAV